MSRRFVVLAWTAAASAYLLIVLGAVVRITGSGMGCGDHWPLCNGRLFPPLDDPGTLIEWSHRLVAAVVSTLVAALAANAWWLRRADRPRPPSTAFDRPGVGSYVALALLLVQVGLGAVTVKLALPPWTVILHLGTAMLLLAALIVAARPHPLTFSTLGLLTLAFGTVLLGALTANLGAASACLGFPLCSGQIVPDSDYLKYIHWTHRLLAYALLGYVAWWAIRTKGRRAWGVVAIITLQLGIGAAMVLLGLPGGLQAAHAAVGAGVWAALVIAAR